MRDEPRVTVLLPVKAYHPCYLRAAVRSILAQTSGAWRLIIVVSGSELVEELGKVMGADLADSRIDVLVEHPPGLAGALNTGLQAARTEFVAILLGDDLWAPNAVKVLERHIEQHPEADFFHSARRIIGDNGEPLSSVHPSRASVRLEDFRRAAPVKHLLCWRRSMALEIGGMDERFGPVGVDDWDFPWSMAEHGAVFCAVPECLYVYRDHRTAVRLTTHAPLTVYVREVWRIMRKHDVPRGVIARFLFDARRGYMRQAMYRTEWERRVRSALGRPPRAIWREKYR